MGKMWVYVDGACFDNGKPWARAGYGVWFGSNHPLNCSGTIQGRQTNQAAEITAAIVALDIATQERVSSLKIFTDSKYLFDGATLWIEKWQNNNWITCSGETVVSKDLWLELEEAINRFGFGRISWRHVPKHCGNFGNMQADRLAKEAASEATDDESDSDDDYEDYSNGYSDDYNDYNDCNGYDGSDDWY